MRLSNMVFQPSSELSTKKYNQGSQTWSGRHKAYKRKLENIGHSIHFPPEKYTVRGFRIVALFGVVGLAALISLDLLLPHPPTIPVVVWMTGEHQLHNKNKAS